MGKCYYTFSFFIHIDVLKFHEIYSNIITIKQVRFVMPMGSLWTPIYHHLVYLVKVVESMYVREVSTYTFTTPFVEDVINGWDNNPYKTIRITGHSLGGGIAIITGAQTGMSTIAVSAPNGKLACISSHCE